MEFHQVEPLNKTQAKQLQCLRKFIKNQKNVCVAFSGGVDSSLVAAIAREQLGSKAIAVTGVSDSLASYLRVEAKQQASWIGIQYEECFTDEINNPAYSKNPENRCYTCKQELHMHLKHISKLSQGAQILDGVNHDDLKEYRPGIKAAQEAGVISPLAELGINKSSVREISKSLGFPWWDKPAQPCLASRFPYGETITSKRLYQISQAEKWLMGKGFHQVRVRVQGLGAKIELPAETIESLIREPTRKQVVNYFLSIGFTSISIDLEGFISGKLNRDRNIDSKTLRNRN